MIHEIGFLDARSHQQSHRLSMNENTQGVAEDNETKFAILRIYLKDVSFETPNSPAIFQGEYNPEIKLELNTSLKEIEQFIFEVVLTITVIARVSDKVAFLAEVQQAGLFHIEGFETERFESMTGAYCPHNLYPYAREAISDLVAKGGFPQLLLAPLNFKEIHENRLLYSQSVQ